VVGLVAVIFSSFLPPPLLFAGWLWYAGLVILFTCPGIFSVINPKYRTIIWLSGATTVPGVLMLAGPLLIVLSSPISYATVSFVSTSYAFAIGFTLLIAGSAVSFGGLLVIIVAWRQSKYITENMTSEGKWPEAA
jgi:hypothetical protein